MSETEDILTCADTCELLSRACSIAAKTSKLARDISHDAERLRKWLTLIANVNACDYEYVKWAMAALEGKEPPFGIAENKPHQHTD